MSSRWCVRKWRGSTRVHIWEVFDTEGQFSGAFDTWAEAMRWATSPIDRLEYWLQHQEVC